MALDPSPEREVSMTELRRETGALCRWAEVNGGRVLIRRHGKVAGVLVPVSQWEMLAKFEGSSPLVERRRFEAEYEGFKRAVEGRPREARPCVVFAPGKEPEGW